MGGVFRAGVYEKASGGALSWWARGPAMPHCVLTLGRGWRLLEPPGMEKEGLEKNCCKAIFFGVNPFEGRSYGHFGSVRNPAWRKCGSKVKAVVRLRLRMRMKDTQSVKLHGLSEA